MKNSYSMNNDTSYHPILGAIIGSVFVFIKVFFSSWMGDAILQLTIALLNGFAAAAGGWLAGKILDHLFPGNWLSARITKFFKKKKSEDV